MPRKYFKPNRKIDTLCVNNKSKEVCVHRVNAEIVPKTEELFAVTAEITSNKNKEKEYTITHVPTGLKIIDWYFSQTKISKAKKLTQQLYDDLSDTEYEAMLRDSKENIDKTVREAIKLKINQLFEVIYK